jgi:hypothetical protein
MKTLSNGRSNDQPLESNLFGTILSPNLFNTKILSTQQLVIIAMMMNMNPIMVVVLVDVLHIQLLKYHDNDGTIIHI